MSSVIISATTVQRMEHNNCKCESRRGLYLQNESSQIVMSVMPSKFQMFHANFRARSTTTRDRNLQFRGAVCIGGSPLDFWLFSSIYVQFSRTRPLKSGESSEKSSGENPPDN